MSPVRRCTRTACSRNAIATLTYVYADSTAVLGPLATYAEPHCYDLCEAHAGRLTVPRGWDVVRLVTDGHSPPDDLEALADVVREHRGRSRGPGSPGSGPADPPSGSGLPPADGEGRRSHLRVLRSPPA